MSHVPTPLQVALVPLRSLTCQLCGISFGIPAEYFVHAAAYGRSICCPEGHVRRVVGDDATQRRSAESRSWRSWLPCTGSSCCSPRKNTRACAQRL